MSTELQGELEEIVMQKQAEIDDLTKELEETQTKLADVTTRALKVYQENKAMSVPSAYQEKQAELEYQLALADRFIKSGAFKVANAEQAFAIIRAGEEMGMTPIESLNGLYIFNGTINPYGKCMTAKISGAGYQIEYKNETKEGVTVRVYNNEGFDVSEVVHRTDEILQRSRAIKISAKNKMRYHGLRMILSFHLAHLFKGVSEAFNQEASVIDVEAVEVEEKKEQLTPEHPKWQGVIKAVAQGTQSIDTMRNHVNISQEVEAQILEKAEAWKLKLKQNKAA